jgi:hypothetical protein
MLFLSPLFAQNDNIPVENDVYTFLKIMQVKGILPAYDDIVLPLSFNEIIKYLQAVDAVKYKLSNIEKRVLNKFQEKYVGYFTNVKPVFGDFPDLMFTDAPKNLYSYRDSSVAFIVNPYLELQYIYGDRYKKAAEVAVGGGNIRLSYSDWLGVNIKATNGIVKGSRLTAKYNKTINQNFNFNINELNTFDESTGYVSLHKGIFNLQIGRERILWGTGYIDKTILSDNPQIFDFVKLDIKYKSLSYKFLHGWLVALPQYRGDTTDNTHKIKVPKYIAISRLGYSNDYSFSIGVTQAYIYGQRPFELAYMNPFLFWESAQRSMNDNDNGYLGFDGRCLIIKGMEANGSILFDDISYLKKWNQASNRLMWQAGLILTAPLIWDNMAVKLEYMQLRPYVFSHYGLADVLTYTNNGYLLGADIQPNSIRISLAMDYYLTSNYTIKIKYYHQQHGTNIYDQSTHKLIKNYGGDVTQCAKIGDEPMAYLLGGERETINCFNAGINWEFFPGYYAELFYEFKNINYQNQETTDSFLYAGLRFAFD